MLSHSIVIPVFNQLHDVKGILALLTKMTSRNSEFVYVDSGIEPYENFIYKYLKPAMVSYVKLPQNDGLINSMNVGYNEAKNSDIITFTHNDVFIYEKDWDIRLLKFFEDHPDVGLVSLFGASGVGQNGARMQTVPAGRAPGFSNMVESDVHGMKLEKEFQYVGTIDGFFFSVRSEILKNTNGFDTRYKYHHFYDRDIALETIRQGYKCVTLDIPSHHYSGVTANRPEYQELIKSKYQSGEFAHTKQYQGDKATHDDNMQRFGDKWGSVLPIYVDKDSGELLGMPYGVGSKIVGFKYE